MQHENNILLWTAQKIRTWALQSFYYFSTSAPVVETGLRTLVEAVNASCLWTGLWSKEGFDVTVSVLHKLLKLNQWDRFASRTTALEPAAMFVGHIWGMVEPLTFPCTVPLLQSSPGCVFHTWASLFLSLLTVCSAPWYLLAHAGCRVITVHSYRSPDTF